MNYLEKELGKNAAMMIYVNKNIDDFVSAYTGQKRSFTDVAICNPSKNSGKGSNQSSGTVNTNHLEKCGVCGKVHGGYAGGEFKPKFPCFMRNHPDANLVPNLPFQDSLTGKAYVKLIPSDPVIGFKKKLNPDKSRLVDYVYVKPAADTAQLRNAKSKCTICTILSHNKNTNNRFLSASFTQNQEHKKTVSVLMDSGADNGSYINSDIANWLVSHGCKYELDHKIICSCFGDCKPIDNYIKATLNFDKLINFENKNCKISLKFWVINNLPHEVVIGNKDIEQNKELYNLFHNKKRDVTDSSVEHLNSHKLARTSTSSSSCTNLSITNQGSLEVSTLVEPKKVTEENEKLSFETANSFNPTEDDNTLSHNGVQPKLDTPIGKVVHISE